jgi:hypothetical protein
VSVIASLLLLASTLVSSNPFAQEDSDTTQVQDVSQDDTPVEVDPVPTPVHISPIWDTLAWCESNQRWHINTGNGYYGGLQEDLVFWRRHGGTQYASRPDLASREAQIAVAITGQSVQGWRAWPSCARRLGLY